MLSNRTLGKFFTIQSLCREKVRAGKSILRRVFCYALGTFDGFCESSLAVSHSAVTSAGVLSATAIVELSTAHHDQIESITR